MSLLQVQINEEQAEAALDQALEALPGVTRDDLDVLAHGGLTCEDMSDPAQVEANRRLATALEAWNNVQAASRERAEYEILFYGK